MSVDACVWVELPALGDPRGKLTFIEGGRHVPFVLRRVFYVYDVPSDTARGAHALGTCHQCLIAVAGSLDVTLDDGRRTRTVRLDRPSAGLLVPPMIWRTMERFAPGTVCLVLASEPYSEADYYRDYAAFLAAVNVLPPSEADCRDRTRGG
jgi:hypothetical protein